MDDTPVWRDSVGPAGGMTRKQVSKRVTWKALQPGIRRADVGIGPYGGVTRGVIQVRAAGWGHPGLRRELGWVFSV